MSLAGTFIKGRTAQRAKYLPLPFYDPEDGQRTPCYCGQKGCVETHISGPALARLYKRISGRDMALQIHSLAKSGDAGAVKTLDIYYELVAKAFVNALYAYDPDVIVIAGGMNVFEGLYTEVPTHCQICGRQKSRFEPETRPSRSHGRFARCGAALDGLSGLQPRKRAEKRHGFFIRKAVDAARSIAALEGGEGGVVNSSSLAS